MKAEDIHFYTLKGKGSCNMNEIEYIENNITYGIVIDWNMIYKEYLKAIKHICGEDSEVMQGIYVPKPPMNSAVWFVEMSERSVGKTTNYIIIGLILYKHYGVHGKTEYIRTHKDGIMPKNAGKLFTTIREYGYIDYIFEGKWNDVHYNARGWYLCKKNDNGEIETIDENEVMHMHSLDTKEVDNEKSVYNSLSNWVIVDEFIPVDGITNEQSFLNLMHLHSTIRRARKSIRTVLLANTINKYTHWFKELCISKDIQTLKMGEQKICTTNRGVKIWVHCIKFSEMITEKRLVNNLEFYGFDNPKLNSIIGGEEWETRNYPHLPKKDDEEERVCVLEKKIYFKVYDDFLALELWNSSLMGEYMYIRSQSYEPKDNAYVYVLNTPMRKNEIYGIGTGRPIERLIVTMYNSHRTFYSHNECGALFDYYLSESKK